MTAGFTTLTTCPVSCNQVASGSPYVPVASRQACTRPTPCRCNQAASSSKPAAVLGQLLRRGLPSPRTNATTNFASRCRFPDRCPHVAPWRGVVCGQPCGYKLCSREPLSIPFDRTPHAERRGPISATGSGPQTLISLPTLLLRRPRVDRPAGSQSSDAGNIQDTETRSSVRCTTLSTRLRQERHRGTEVHSLT